ncbi:hypothetical protein GFS31_39320 [Leptolyngbya sp. BL0902]|nr:hypothetical protein GFS31_39320 [Leptolyngbya sp. BL0902]
MSLRAPHCNGHTRISVIINGQVYTRKIMALPQCFVSQARQPVKTAAPNYEECLLFFTVVIIIGGVFDVPNL